MERRVIWYSLQLRRKHSKNESPCNSMDSMPEQWGQKIAYTNTGLVCLVPTNSSAPLPQPSNQGANAWRSHTWKTINHVRFGMGSHIDRWVVDMRNPYYKRKWKDLKSKTLWWRWGKAQMLHKKELHWVRDRFFGPVGLNHLFPATQWENPPTEMNLQR